MSRMREPRFKKCRRLGLNVVGHPKAMKREGAGQNRDRKKQSAYGRQLLEKQRLRGYYEVMEKQFKNYVAKAINEPGLSGDILVRNLETRLDNMTYRMGFAASIRQARQMVVHGHLLVNGKKVDRPSYALAVGDVVSLREKSRQTERFKENIERHLDNLPYITSNSETFSAKLIRMPERDEVPIQIDDHLVIEYYSKLI